MPRNKHGWLKADALKQGIPEQVARDVDGVRHSVQIVHDLSRGGFVTEHRGVPISPDAEQSWFVHEWQFGSDLPAARERFREEVRGL